MSNSNLFERIIKTDALLLATAPIVANAIVLSAYYPSFEKYNIPLSFFKPDVVDIALISLSVLISFYFGFVIVSLVATRLPFFQNTSALIFLSFLATAVIIADGQDNMGMLEVGKKWRTAAQIAIPLYLLYLLISFLVTQKEKNKLVVNDTRISKFVNGLAENGQLIKFVFEPAFSETYKFIGKKGLIFLVFACEVCMYTYSMGNSFAQIQSTFIVANTTPECVVQYMNSEYAICYPLIRPSKEVLNGFRVLYFKDNQDVVFSSEQLGELNLVKPTPVNTPTPNSTETATPTATATVISHFTPTLSATAIP